jgi:hypothetical protein
VGVGSDSTLTARERLFLPRDLKGSGTGDWGLGTRTETAVLTLFAAHHADAARLDDDLAALVHSSMLEYHDAPLRA